jgi:hypothetical protein
MMPILALLALSGCNHAPVSVWKEDTYFAPDDDVIGVEGHSYAASYNQGLICERLDKHIGTYPTNIRSRVARTALFHSATLLSSPEGLLVTSFRLKASGHNVTEILMEDRDFFYYALYERPGKGGLTDALRDRFWGEDAKLHLDELRPINTHSASIEPEPHFGDIELPQEWFDLRDALGAAPFDALKGDLVEKGSSGNASLYEIEPGHINDQPRKRTGQFCFTRVGKRPPNLIEYRDGLGREAFEIRRPDCALILAQETFDKGTFARDLKALAASVAGF